MIHFPRCTLQQAASHGERLSSFFDAEMLSHPQSLAFEKVLFPTAFYKKKMYAALKYEGDYSEGASGKIFARGLSAVRRDNAKLVQKTVLDVMDLLFKKGATRDETAAFAGAAFAAVHNSAVLVHAGAERDFPGRLPFEAFVQSAGISKELAEYDGDNSATAVARQMLAANPQCGIGKNSRVTFVVTAAPKGSKRCHQALLPSVCLAETAPLDAGFYTGALLKKLAPMMSVLYMQEEAASRRTRTLDGSVVAREPDTAAARARLLGEAHAERAILAAASKAQKLVYAPKELRPSADEPPRPAAKRKAAPAKDPRQKGIAGFGVLGLKMNE